MTKKFSLNSTEIDTVEDLFTFKDESKENITKKGFGYLQHKKIQNVDTLAICYGYHHRKSSPNYVRYFHFNDEDKNEIQEFKVDKRWDNLTKEQLINDLKCFNQKIYKVDCSEENQFSFNVLNFDDKHRDKFISGAYDSLFIFESEDDKMKRKTNL